MALTPEQIAALSNDDLEGLYLGTLGGTGSLEDKRQFVYGDEPWVYFSNLSGLTPKESFMLADHQYAYYMAQVGGSATVEVLRNRVINPSAETGILGWISSRATIVQDTSKARYGTGSFKLTVTDVSSQNYLVQPNVPAERTPVTGSETVRMLASVWVPVTHTTVKFQLYEYDAAGVLLTPIPESQNMTATGGQWTDLGADFTVKPLAASVRLVVMTSQSIGIGTDWWVDGIALGAGLTTYFDGSTPVSGGTSYAWTGTPNASASVQNYTSAPPTLTDLERAFWGARV